MSYRKKVGGYEWSARLAEMRQDVMRASDKLDGLLPAAQTMQTKADVLEVQTIVLRVALRIEELMRMESK